MDGFEHQPVMAREVVELLAAVPAGTRRRRDRRRRGARPASSSRPDPTSRCSASTGTPTQWRRPGQRLAPSGTGPGSCTAASRTSPTSCTGSGRTRSEGNIVGILFDLGVSSPQLDRRSAASRTGATRRSTCAWTAAGAHRGDVVNDYARRARRVIATNGEERFARADRGAHRRARGRCSTTGDLVDAVRRPCPAPRSRGAVATRRAARSRRSAWR